MDPAGNPGGDGNRSVLRSTARLRREIPPVDERSQISSAHLALAADTGRMKHIQMQFDDRYL
jgi:hypothetical protein